MIQLFTALQEGFYFFKCEPMLLYDFTFYINMLTSESLYGWIITDLILILENLRIRIAYKAETILRNYH